MPGLHQYLNLFIITLWSPHPIMTLYIFRPGMTIRALPLFLMAVLLLVVLTLTLLLVLNVTLNKVDQVYSFSHWSIFMRTGFVHPWQGSQLN